MQREGPARHVPPPAAGDDSACADGRRCGKIDRLDPALDALVAPAAVIEKVAGGFKFTEGPLWRPDGTLWFSDVQGNVVRSVTPDGKVTVLIENAGGESTAPPDSYIGPNGMAEAPDGSVWMVQHFNRQIVRINAGSLDDADGVDSSRASGSTARTIWCSPKTARCTSPTRRTAC